MSRQGGGDSRREADAPLELESQFVLRMPEAPATALREMLRTGANLKDRCVIRLENDLRYGEVRVDNWVMHAKVVDLPTIVESLKTIDNKSFYKTADICQMMICKEEADQPQPEEDTAKAKKRDPFKVEKKFLWPHGVTPPTKNVRKRRFRKTLKKKYVEAPEIEKEVKRLLRFDNEAVHIKWEVLSDEEDQGSKAESGANADREQADVAVKKEKAPKVKAEQKTSKRERPVKNELKNEDGSNADVERDIFGGAVSDSDEEIGSNLNPETNDNSRLSYDSRPSESNSLQGGRLMDSDGRMPTQFASEMFRDRSDRHRDDSEERPSMNPSADNSLDRSSTGENLRSRAEMLSLELETLRNQRMRKEQEIASMENLALRQRFQDLLDDLIRDIEYKEMEYRELQELLLMRSE